jgi:hypothetical protein
MHAQQKTHSSKLIKKERKNDPLIFYPTAQW